MSELGDLRLRVLFAARGGLAGVDLIRADDLILVSKSLLDQWIREERDQATRARGPIRLDGEILSVRLVSDWTIRYRWIESRPIEVFSSTEFTRHGQSVWQRIAGLPPPGWSREIALIQLGWLKQNQIGDPAYGDGGLTTRQSV